MQQQQTSAAFNRELHHHAMTSILCHHGPGSFLHSLIVINTNCCSMQYRTTTKQQNNTDKIPPTMPPIRSSLNRISPSPSCCLRHSPPLLIQRCTIILPILASTPRLYSSLSSSNTSNSTSQIPTPGPFPNPTNTSLSQTTKEKPWSQLTAWSRVKRSTRNTADFSIILLGGLLVIGVFTSLYTDIFNPNSKWSWFSHSVSLIKSDPRCLALLGRADKLVAHGDVGGGRGGWGKHDRGINATEETDAAGTQHIKMVFTVEGERNVGRVHAHVVKRKGDGEWKYELLCVDVKGEKTVFLEDNRSAFGLERGARSMAPAKKFLGIQWGFSGNEQPSKSMTRRDGDKN